MTKRLISGLEDLFSVWVTPIFFTRLSYDSVANLYMIPLE